ncbi:MAG: type I pullulanase [Butyrivibrio sp.]|nr:type I pullulanase [Butyrivibrio sp.]
MKKIMYRIWSVTMAFILLFGAALTFWSLPVTVRAEDGVTIRLHYNRPDGEYDGWDVWMWPEGGEGAAYAFEEKDGEQIATFLAQPGVSSVGFIVRTQDWTKDINEDQFIDISEMVSGSVDIYVESGVEGYSKEYGEDAVTGTKLKKACYNQDGTITITLTGEADDAQKKSLKVTGRDGETLITGIEDGDEEYTYVCVLEKELDINKSYKITFEDTEYDINMPIIYSTEEFEKEYTYSGDDLGMTYTSNKTDFRVWAPTADAVTLNLYESGNSWADDLCEQIEMTKDVNGTWTASKSGDCNGIYYTFTAELDGRMVEACDPYARTTGVNGKRAMVIDLDSTDPQGWDEDTNPHAGESINDAIIYELHLRDLSADESSGITNTGKFLGLAETGTVTASGISTGLDHIVDLGITHVHLLPIYDFGSVDETHTYENLYNWGYDPVNYNVPEGSYSTDASDGQVRVSELKTMIKTMHDNGLSVVMDVVYNHVYSGDDFCINRLVPGYFSRINSDGTYSNGSGCGNDTASERSMVKKYIVDSVCYWADEYHMDGFRFDLVGLLDTETVNEIVEEVHKDHPDVIFYGEGWSMSTDLTKEGYTLATQVSSEKTPDFAFFNDTIRDALKGSVFNTGEAGFVSGALNKENSIATSFMAMETWSKNPSQIIQYASCHDNLSLFDRIQIVRTDASFEELVKMNNLAAAIYLTSEGVPFMQAGEEMLRSKVKEDGSFDENSYASGDEVNAIKWDNLDNEEYMETYEFYKGLIEFRKEHPALRLTDSESISESVTAITPDENTITSSALDKNMVAFDIKGDSIEGENAGEIFIVFNANNEAKTVEIPDGNWNVYVRGNEAGTEILDTVSDKNVNVEAISSLILVKEDAKMETIEENNVSFLQKIWNFIFH